MIRKEGIAARALATLSDHSGLARYDAACRAIAEARSVDEVKAIRDTAEAMRAAAHVAKNKQAEIDMAEIRFRGERRLGELMAAQRESVGLNEGSRLVGPGRTRQDDRPTLAEAGIDKHLADRARKFAAIPDDEFDGIVGDWREKVEAENERVTTNLLKAGEKRLSRDEREADLASRIAALPDKKFGVIYADPEWRFEPYSRDTGMDRAADNHYPTTVTDEIAARPVESIAADDCVLFLWATAPMLPDALRVMSAWGFTYKSQIIWGKDRIGTGYWARNKHELLLIGTRGNIPAPEMGTQPESLIIAPVGRHSEKPEIFAELIERYFPTLPKIELNRRGPARPGWDAWGNEAESFDPETGELTDTQEQPETASQSADMAVGLAGPALAGSLPAANTKPAPNSPSDAASSDAVAEPQAPRPTATATLSDDDVPAFIKRDYVLRPHCLNPSLCAGSGREHCHRCKRALAESEAA